MIIREVTKLPFYINRGIKYCSTELLSIPKVKSIFFAPTYRCNAKCNMCFFWKIAYKDKELTIEEIKNLFRSSLFRQTEGASLLGGEPLLRYDIIDIIDIIINSTYIKWMTLCTNSLDTTLIEKKIKEIMSLKNFKKLNKFIIILSLDGYSDTHDKIRGISGAYKHVVDTIELLINFRKSNKILELEITCVVQPLNIRELPILYKLAREWKIAINFVPIFTPSIPENYTKSEEDSILAKSNIKILKGFFSSKLFNINLFNNSRQNLYRVMNNFFWENYFQILEGKKRRIPCPMLYHSININPFGTISFCGLEDSQIGNIRSEDINRIWNSRKTAQIRHKMKTEYCFRCGISCAVNLALTRNFFQLLKFILIKSLKNFLFNQGN